MQMWQVGDERSRMGRLLFKKWISIQLEYTFVDEAICTSCSIMDMGVYYWGFPQLHGSGIWTFVYGLISSRLCICLLSFLNNWFCLLLPAFLLAVSSGRWHVTEDVSLKYSHSEAVLVFFFFRRVQLFWLSFASIQEGNVFMHVRAPRKDRGSFGKNLSRRYDNLNHEKQYQTILDRCLQNFKNDAIA